MSPHGRIIVADDDVVTSHLLSAVLRRSGFEPEAVVDVPALQRACASGSPVAILLDMHMPGGTGADSLDDLRRLIPGVPVIVVSGSAEDSARAEAMAHGAYAYVTKPIDLQPLLALVARATGRDIR